MVEVGIAVGVGVGAFLLVCCLCWGLCKLRHGIKTGRIATLKEILAERRRGVKKDVVRTFPIVETSELNFEFNSKPQCPICWLQFSDPDTTRQLPICDHVFHRHCIDPVLENQITCPVCGTIVTDNLKLSGEILNGKHRTSSPPPYEQQVSLRSLYSLNTSAPADPSWMLVNRPLPLPRSGNEHSSSSDRFEIEINPSESFGGSGESPLLSKYLNGVDDWPSDDVELDQKCIDISFTFGTEVPVEKRQPRNPNERSVDSFSFTPPGGKTTPSDGAVTEFRSSSRRSRGKDSASFSDASTRFSRNSSRSSSLDSRFDKSETWDSAREHLEEVAEGDAGDYHRPLTNPPDQCSFDVLPVVAGTFGSQGHSARFSTMRNIFPQL